MKRRILSFILSFVMILSLLPLQVLADEVQTSSMTATIVVQDEAGNDVPNANIRVTRDGKSYAVTVLTSESEGQYRFTQYQFTKDAAKQSDIYDISVEKIGYESQTVTMRGTTNTIIVTLHEVTGEQWRKFQVMSGERQLLEINVDLKALANSSAVQYSENSGGKRWEFAPKSTQAAFWTAVQDCMDVSSKSALEAAGLGVSDFEITSLAEKMNGDCVAVANTAGLVELYDENGLFVGAVLSSDEEHEKAHEWYAKYLNMAWDANKHVYINDNNKVYEITIGTMDSNPECYEIKHRGERKEMAVVTYTDGVDGEDIFSEQKHAVVAGADVPGYVGTPTRSGYTFKRWALPDGTTHTGGVNANITLHAVWEIAANYTGTVKVYQGGSFTSTGAVSGGTLKSIEAILGGNVQLYVSKDKTNYVKLTSTETGVYSAGLENGKYYIYAGDGTTYTQLGNQILWMENADRTCYLFYNYTVKYDCGYGTVSGEGSEFTELGLAGSEIEITTKEPALTGYEFVGWKDEATGKVYQSGNVLTAALDKNYRLTAQWIQSGAQCDFKFTVNATYSIRKNVGAVEVEVVRISSAGSSVVARQQVALTATDTPISVSVDPGYYYSVQMADYTYREDAADKNTTYGAIITVSDIDALGAYIDAVNGQQSSVKMTIVPVNTHELVLYTEEGAFVGGGQEIVLETSRLPDLSEYSLTPEEGRKFVGWEWEEGKKVGTDEPLQGNVVLRAIWEDVSEADTPGSAESATPTGKITIEGQITVDNGYRLTDQGQVTHHIINPVDRATNITVLLQRAVGTIGYYETIAVTSAQVKAGNTAVERPCGCTDEHQAIIPITVMEYSFRNMPADGQYRVVALSPNYTSTYQLETDSINAPGEYSTYGEKNGNAVNLTSDNVATVNALMQFTPSNFPLTYQVDASEIGKDYRPTDVEILVTYDDRKDDKTDPSQWQVISQMEISGVQMGDVVPLDANGIGEKSYDVWSGTSDGTVLYDYGIRVGKITMPEDEGTTSTPAPVDENETDGEVTGSGNTGDNEAAPEVVETPYHIEYTAPAHLDPSQKVQNKTLVAKLVPKTYSITYELNGGSFAGKVAGVDYPTSHTWSQVTNFNNVVPTRRGYQFEGWYVKNGNTESAWTAQTIPAEMTGDIVFHAKWSRIVVNLQVVMDHGDNGERGTINTQLTQKEKDQANYQPVGNEFKKNYLATLWNVGNATNAVDVVEIPCAYAGLDASYVYNANITVSSYDILDSIMVNGSVVEAGVKDVERAITDKNTTEMEHNVVACLQYDSDLLHLCFDVEIDEEVETFRWPEAVGVKVTYWDVTKSKWAFIEQHENTVMEIPIGAVTSEDGTVKGVGTGVCAVKRWQDETKKIPHYYRVEVVSLRWESKDPENPRKPVILGETAGYDATVSVTGGETPEGAGLSGAYGNGSATDQVGTIQAVVDMGKVVFHANNTQWNEQNTKGDVFRTYYPAAEAGADYGEFYLKADGSIATTYAIPEFDYLTHNEYIFSGWYDSKNGGTAMNWTDQYLINSAEDVHFYANWIVTDEVEKDAADNKVTQESKYQGFDLFGVQIRFAQNDNIPHHGTPGPGLRFLGSMSEAVHDTLEELHNQARTKYDLEDSLEENLTYGFEYGFVLTPERVVKGYLEEKRILESDYWLLFNDANVNGVDTRSTHYFVLNQRCNGKNEKNEMVIDHYNGTTYRIFTAVITYDEVGDMSQEAAQEENIVARAYLRYLDANGLLRIYHNNYRGTRSYGGLSVSYATVADVVPTA